jgi:hypothetical protein
METVLMILGLIGGALLLLGYVFFLMHVFAVGYCQPWSRLTHQAVRFHQCVKVAKPVDAADIAVRALLTRMQRDVLM